MPKTDTQTQRMQHGTAESTSKTPTPTRTGPAAVETSPSSVHPHTHTHTHTSHTERTDTHTRSRTSRPSPSPKFPARLQPACKTMARLRWRTRPPLTPLPCHVTLPPLPRPPSCTCILRSTLTRCSVKGKKSVRREET